MKDKEILYRVLQKAQMNGYVYPNIVNIKEMQYYNLIFNHEFAKAFWGNQKYCNTCKNQKWIYEGVGNIPCPTCNNDSIDWRYHLQRMVIEKEPLKYLEKFL